MSRRILLLFSIAALAVLSGCKKTPPTLSLLVWEGYADPSFIQGFEAKCQCKVSAAYMGSSDELVAKLRGGAASNYDVISPSSDVATMLSRSGLVAPLDLSKIPNYAQLSPNLTSRPLVRQEGKVYGVPLTWGPNPLLYDTSAFPKAPATWAELWDPKFANKLSFWDDLSTMYMAAEVLGFGKADPTAIYNLDDAPIAAGEAKAGRAEAEYPQALDHRRRAYQPVSKSRGHRGHGLAAGDQPTAQERSACSGGDSSGRHDGWIDHLMITSSSDNKELAYQLLNYLASAQAQKQLSDVTGYIPANPQAAALMTAEQRHSLHLDDIDAYQHQIVFWQDVPRRAKYTEIWNEVKASQ